jgi:polyphosphate kinase
LFNYLTTGYKPNRGYKKLLPSPKMFKRALLEKILREIEQHRPDAPGLIQIKVNALEDPDVTRALYRAAEAGVKVDLLVRDTCQIRPGIPGLSESIRVISIVGRFLEHARVYYFRNGGDEEYFIGSADCMDRNLMSRVEIIVPVESPELQEELRFVLDTQLKDKRCAWEMQPDGSYVQRGGGTGKKTKGTHQELIEWAERRHKEATRLKRRKPRGLHLRPTD